MIAYFCPDPSTYDSKKELGNTIKPGWIVLCEDKVLEKIPNGT
jgi:hypothetical protein